MRLSIASLVVVLALIYGAVRLGPGLFSGPPYDTMKIPFDQATWLRHADSDEHSNPRRAMLTDVRRRLVRPGVRKEDVLKLLGPPTQDDVTSLIYVCGWDGAFQMDTWNFKVEISPAGLVVTTREYQG